jgi:hypothetical protein
MTLERFEAMTRFMTASGTRRGLVRGGLAVLGFGALRLPWADEAAAQRNCTVCINQGDCPFTSVQAALTAAAPGSTVTVCKGTYKETVTIPRNLTLVADRNEDVVLDGSDRGTVVTVEPGVTAAIQGLHITDGRGRDVRSFGRGGGILNFGSLTVTDCVIEDNNAQSGGGISNEDRARLTLVKSLVVRNSCDPPRVPGPPAQGGGIFNGISGFVRVVSSIVDDNTAGIGGGIANQGIVTITDESKVTGNAANSGGGVFSISPVEVLNGSTVGSNRAEEDGGGVLITSGELILIDARIVGNKARRGGGVAVGSPGGGSVTARSSDIVSNDATDTGGGIFVRDRGRVTLDAESQVRGNDPNNCVGTNACPA